MTRPDPAPVLSSVIDRFPALAVAVSGGVDSMVLAHVVHRLTDCRLSVFHAVSPAVPAAATARVRRHAARWGWTLHLIDAEELIDPRYRANPVDRCLYCKLDLYGHIRGATALPVASGTNVDDLGDYRPGLEAARRHGVIHPFVEAGLAKADVYRLAKALDLDDLAVLPAQPCLASRIETGITVEAGTLGFVERAETALRHLLPGARDLRCRITAEGVVVEADPEPAEALRSEVERVIAALCGEAGRVFVGIRAYRRGSAFLREAPARHAVGGAGR